MKVDVRACKPDELDPLVMVLRAAGLGANVSRLLQFSVGSPAGEVLVAARDGEVTGGGAVAVFGQTGWIGALGVLDRARRRGIGGAVTEGCVDWLRQRGARTVLLHATSAGRPVYQRAGFVNEGEARSWRDIAPPRTGAAPGPIRALYESDLAAVRSLDAAATGEDRGAVFDTLAGRLTGLAATNGNGDLAGSALRSPWGLGPSVVASNPEAGLALVSALRRAPGGPLTVSLPEANIEGSRALRAWGFQPVNSATRMRLGPSPAYDPARVFGMFNLFWG